MKKLLVVLVVSMFVLMSCAHKEACKSEKEAGCESKEAHVCTETCDHSDHKAMAKDHVCTEACDHSTDAMAKDHKCSAECQAKWMAAHMEKMGADHVCTDECKAECKSKHAEGEHAGEAVEGEHAGEAVEEEGHEGGEDKD